jgi:hypothetical protein
MTFNAINGLLYDNLAVIVIIGFTNVYILIGVPIFLILMYCLFRVSVPAYRETSRVVSVSQSPIIN